jgi:hypothetical protein
MQHPKFLLALLFSALSISIVQAQQKHAVSGLVKDKQSGETLIGATVYLKGAASYSTTSNSYGFYSVSAPAGNYMLVVSFTGYAQDSMAVTLTQDRTIQLSLTNSSQQLNEVVVRSTRSNNVSGAQMGVQKLTTNEMKKIPVLFGEKDVLKTMQLLPGVKSAGDGNGGFYVRGGGIDQNLILLDEAPVYNASHLLGFFSTFNSDAIKDLTLYKGAMPAEYGGRLSSVVDIRTNDGNNKEYHASGGLGLIASHLNFEGPIVKDKGSFMISARRTYADLFLKLSSDTTTKNSSLYFYDLNLKANYSINDRNRIYLSGYLGKDAMGLNNLFGLNYGNSTATLRWNHIFSNQLFSNTSLLYSNYKYNISITQNSSSLLIKSNIEDLALKQDFQAYFNSNNKLKFGFDVTHHTINPGVIDASASSNINSQALQKKYAIESAVYADNELGFMNNKLKLDYGLRLSAFSVLGPGSFYTYDAAGNAVDTSTYSKGKVVKTYVNLEPRVSTGYQFNSNNSVKLSYTRNVQNLHLIANSTTSDPTDLWIPSSPNVKPEIADQVSLGYYKNLASGKYEFSSEVYYKNLQNQIDYKNGAQLRANDNVESQLLYGNGRAYGLELYMKKKTGLLTGWVSYTLSRTERKIDGINSNNWYPAKQDQTHNIAIVGMYQLTKKWTLSANWVYNTGNAVTFPSGKYAVDGQTVFYYTERNGYRMPAYHRLDLGATWEGKKTQRWHSSWTFSLYNAYGRENAYSIEFKDDPNNPQHTQAVQTSLFRWVPSVTYNFEF